MLKAIVEGELPEELQDYYKKSEDGTYVLQVEPVDGWALEDISGLKSTLSKELTRRKTAEKKLSALGDIDPEEAVSAVNKLSEMQQIDPNAEADKIAKEKVDAALKKMAAKHGSEIDKLMSQLNEKNSKLDLLTRRDEIVRALEAERGVPELLEPIILQKSRLNDDMKVEILDDDGNPMFGSSGDLLTVREYVAQLKQDSRYGRAFHSSGNSGTGKVPTASGKEVAANAGLGGDKQERIAAIKTKFNL